MAAILNILKTKSTTLSDDLFLCQASKGSAVWSEFKKIGTLVTMATAAIFNLFNPSKAATHYGGYSYKVSWSLMKGIQIKFKSPLFSFHGNCDKVCPIRVITKLPNSEQSYKGKVKTHNYINRQNQSTTGKLWKA